MEEVIMKKEDSLALKGVAIIMMLRYHIYECLLTMLTGV